MSYLKSLFDGKLERTYSHVWDILVSESTDLHPAEVYEDIQVAFREGLIDPTFIDTKDVERALRQEQSHLIAKLSKYNKGYITNAIKDMGWWSCFDQPHGSPQGLPPLVEDDTSLPSVKVGPNEPCICGSGKKYKKCCGRVA